MAYHLFLTSRQASSRMSPWKSAVWTSSNPLSLKQLRSRWTHHNQLWPQRNQCSSHIMSTHSWCTMMNCSVCSHLWSNGFPAITKILMLQHNWSRCWYNCCGTPRSKKVSYCDKFTIARFEGCDSDFRFWTGFYSYVSFKLFWTHYVEPNASAARYWGADQKGAVDDDSVYDKPGPKRRLAPIDELFLTLVKLKRGRSLAIKTVSGTCSINHQ